MSNKELNRSIVGYLDRLHDGGVAAVCVLCTEEGKAHSAGAPVYAGHALNWADCHVCRQPLMIDRLKVFEDHLEEVQK